METLLDRHLATFDTWLHTHFLSLTGSSRNRDYLVVATLLDQLDPKKFNWEQVSVILRHQSPFSSNILHLLFDGTKFDIEFIRIASKCLMDRDRAGSLWVDSHRYADLVKYILEILRNK